MSDSSTPKERPALPSAAELAALPPDGGPEWNRLVFEQSPYLLQHAANPVDWWPWGEAAFEEARKQDKPVFLSVGYSTCHWCHVMEHESFEDEEVAALLNEHMIPIKVDREERPDIDQVYMAVTQAMTGQGGWPMTVVMTPEKKPYFAGTYFPKRGGWGRPGMMDIIPALGKVWREDRPRVLGSADGIAEAFAEMGAGRPGELPGEEALRAALQDFTRSFDRVHGGFGGGRNKFPVPHNQSLLVRLADRFKDPNALAMVEKTLTAMRLGGIWDHVGGGFHRYSTDQEWFIPHFEKMLYDQAMQVISYTDAYQRTGSEFYKWTALDIIAYVHGVMTSPEGAFYSAEDADSEGVEGKFYLWTREEIEEVLGKDDAALFCEVYNVTADGNYHEEATGQRTGESLPFLSKPLEREQDRMGFANRLAGLRGKLFAHREKRIHPFKDDKILTDWNGLMIAALARAHMGLGMAGWFSRPGSALRADEMAMKAADFVLAHLRTLDGRLVKRVRHGKAGLPAHLEDYAFMAWGLIELYEATFEVRYLQEAVALTETMIERFRDPRSGGFFHTADDSETLLMRAKDAYDGAIPSGNGVAACNLVRLAKMTGNKKYEGEAVGVLRAFGKSLDEQPMGHAQMLQALDMLLGPSTEIVLAGKDVGSWAFEARTRPRPNAVLLHRTANEDSPIFQIAPFLKALPAPEKGAVAYVCRNHACSLPAKTWEEFQQRLDEAGLGAKPRAEG